MYRLYCRGFKNVAGDTRDMPGRCRDSLIPNMCEITVRDSRPWSTRAIKNPRFNYQPRGSSESMKPSQKRAKGEGVRDTGTFRSCRYMAISDQIERVIAMRIKASWRPEPENAPMRRGRKFVLLSVRAPARSSVDRIRSYDGRPEIVYAPLPITIRPNGNREVEVSSSPNANHRVDRR